jgi:hypothetical protein
VCERNRRSLRPIRLLAPMAEDDRVSVGNLVERAIVSLRGHRVLLDSDLASLYGVETAVLNQAVRRNLARFPADFGSGSRARKLSF